MPQVPFERGGAEIFADGLVCSLREHGHETELVTVLPQRADEPVHEDLGAAALERHLRHADREPHAPTACSASSSMRREEIVDESKQHVVDDALVSAKAGSTSPLVLRRMHLT